LRKLLFPIAVLSMLAVPVVAATAAGTTKTTTVRDDFFVRSKLTIAKDTVVVWQWKSTEDPHTVTDTKKRFGSKRKVRGSYKHTFTKVGRYTVYCKVHPTTMRQKIVVE
jgi:plastocyanin